MFVRTKTTDGRTYLQMVESYRENGRVRQRVLCTLGRLDKLKDNSQIEGLIRSLSRFSEKIQTLDEYKKGEIETRGVKRVGPDLILARLWSQLGLKQIIKDLLRERKYGFDLERAIYLATLSRLFFCGSDRRCSRLARDYQVAGTEEIDLHHLYRAMAWLGANRHEVEELLFARNRNLFSSLSVVFFDTTSLYFEGAGGRTLGRRGYSKDRRPDENQMIVGAVLDGTGRPIASPMWPGNTSDAATLIPVTRSLKDRFGVGEVTLVADRGMVGKRNTQELEAAGFSYILGVKMRLEKKAMREVLSRAGRYQQVADNLKVKEVLLSGKRYIVCVNPWEARKDSADRFLILTALGDKLKSGAAALVGNTGYRRYLKIERGSVRIDSKKVAEEERYDGKWVLITNTKLPASEVAARYKELWRVEQVFRDTKSVLETRPIYHQSDPAIMGHVFVSFLALCLMKELRSRINFDCEWDEIRQDLDALYEVEVEARGKTWFLRNPLQGVAGKIFRAVGVAPPPTARSHQM